VEPQGGPTLGKVAQSSGESQGVKTEKGDKCKSQWSTRETWGGGRGSGDTIVLAGELAAFSPPRSLKSEILWEEIQGRRR